MPVSVTLPALGESVTEGTVTRWLKQVGDQVQTDEPLLEVSTDKVDTEIPAPASGVLLEIKVGEDETIEVGAELAVIGQDGEQPGGQAAPQPAAQPEPTPEPDPEPAAQPSAAPAAEPAAAEPRHAAPEPEPAAAAPAPAAAPASAPSPGSNGTAVTLPALGESVTEGTVTRWLKQVGDQVQTDEPLLEVSTDKVDTEIPAPASGTLLEIKVGEDETVEVGAELAVIGADTGAAAPQAPAAPAAPTPQPAAPAAPAPEPAAPAAPAAPATQSVATPAAVQPDQPTQGTEPEAVPAGDGDGGGKYVTPLVRKLATEHGIDLGSLRGTGVGGRIRKQDVLEAAEAKKQAAAAPAAAPAATATAPSAPSTAPAAEPSPLRGTTEKLPRMRKIIAARMVESLQTAAQLTTVLEVDVTGIARLRNRVKNDFVEREGVKLSFLPFFAKATVEALKQHHKLNASLDLEAGEVTYHGTENLVIAVDTERGLLVPVIKNAGDLNIAGLARKIADLANRARTNKLSPDDLTGGTFTLTNTGSVGVLFDTPIFPQPQVAMLGTGAVVKRPVVIDDPNLGETIAVRHMVYLSLSYDHRIVDGADAARFLNTIKQRLEEAHFESEFGL